MRLDYPIQIIDYEEMTVALEAASEQGRVATLITPPSAAWYAGPLYWQSMIEDAREAWPDLAFRLIVDCGEDPGMVMKSLSFGLQYLRFDGEAEVARQLAEMASHSEAFLVTIGGEVLELGTREEKERACKEWLERHAALDVAQN